MAADRTQTDLTMRDRIRTLLDEGATAALATLLVSEGLETGAKLLISERGETIGDLGDATLNDAALVQAKQFLASRDEARTISAGEFAPQLPLAKETLVLFERIESEPRLIVAGAGHVGASLARLAALVGYDVTLIDDRAAFVTREMFSSPAEQGINLITAVSWADAIRDQIRNGRGVSVAIVTRGHKQDEDCLRAAIGASPHYIGMIGSKRRTNIVLDKLREEGFDRELLDQVRAPIGLDIGAVSPEEVALAILAEIIAERHGGAGMPLSAWRR